MANRCRMLPFPRPGGRHDTYCVRLTRKLAERIDGVDLSEAEVGDLLLLPPRDASLLVAEGWGEYLEEEFASARTSAPRWRAAERARGTRSPERAPRRVRARTWKAG